MFQMVTTIHNVYFGSDQSYLGTADIKKNVTELATVVYQIRGTLQGKTFLPFPEVGPLL